MSGEWSVLSVEFIVQTCLCCVYAIGKVRIPISDPHITIACLSLRCRLQHAADVDVLRLVLFDPVYLILAAQQFL